MTGELSVILFLIGAGSAEPDQTPQSGSATFCLGPINGALGKNGLSLRCSTADRLLIEPSQANLCLRAFRHDKF